MYSKKLEIVNTCVYLGNTLSRSNTHDEEIGEQMDKTCDAYSKLETRQWSQLDITITAKISVYEACVLAACKTWTTYRRHIKRQEHFHQKSLQSYTLDRVVLERASIPSIESIILKNCLQCCGHMVQLEDGRVPKQVVFGELRDGERPVG